MSNVRFRKSSMLSNKDRQKQMREELQRQIVDITPLVYASLALALNRHWGFGYKRINRLFVQSQEIWDELDNESMIELCERETGIKLMGK